MSIIHYDRCPSCASDNIQAVLRAEDFTVSHEIFEIWECRNCTLRFTQDVPDENGIGKYYKSTAYISHTDTREGLINSAYHRVRNITLHQKKKLIQSKSGLTSGSLLDIGAGTGAFAAYMQQAGWDVTGLEPDPQTRERAESINRISLKPADHLFELAPDSYDVITMWHVLEHVHLLHEYMERIFTILKDDGFACIAVPNYTSKDAAHYGRFWAAYDVPRHLYHFTPDSMRKLAASHQLGVSAVKPMWFDSFYVSMLSESYKKGSVQKLDALIQGAKSNLAALSNHERCSSLIYLLYKND